MAPHSVENRPVSRAHQHVAPDRLAAVWTLLYFAVVVVVAGLASMLRTVRAHTWLVVQRHGRQPSVLEPGLHLLVPIRDKVLARIDQDAQTLRVRTPIIARDGYVVGVDLGIGYRVEDPLLFSRQDAPLLATEFAAVGALRELAETRDRDDLLAPPATDEIKTAVTNALRRARDSWGLTIRSVDVAGVHAMTRT